MFYPCANKLYVAYCNPAIRSGYFSSTGNAKAAPDRIPAMTPGNNTERVMTYVSYSVQKELDAAKRSPAQRTVDWYAIRLAAVILFVLGAVLNLARVLA